MSKKDCPPEGEAYSTHCKRNAEAVLEKLVRGQPYNFKNQPERLVYVGRHNSWHQFEKIGTRGVWCELLDSDLHMLEETKPE